MKDGSRNIPDILQKIVKTKNINIKTDEIDRLEKDLAEIESRLNSI